MKSEAASEHERRTERFVDELFGPGMGARHLQFLEKLENSALREMIHRYHPVEADVSEVSLTENYLIGMAVLAATGHLPTAAMFAKVLRHLGVPRSKILEVVGRLGMWIGGLPAAEVSFAIQRALNEWEARGLESMAVWFPSQDVEVSEAEQ